MRFGIEILAALTVVLLIPTICTADELTDADKAIVMKTITDDLKDPESARFKWLPLAEPETTKYCGLVNAKNSFGGYTGDVPFMVFLTWQNEKVVIAMPIRIGSADWESPKVSALLEMCGKYGYSNFREAE